MESDCWKWIFSSRLWMILIIFLTCSTHTFQTSQKLLESWIKQKEKVDEIMDIAKETLIYLRNISDEEFSLLDQGHTEVDIDKCSASVTEEANSVQDRKELYHYLQSLSNDIRLFIINEEMDMEAFLKKCKCTQNIFAHILKEMKLHPNKRSNKFSHSVENSYELMLVLQNLVLRNLPFLEQSIVHERHSRDIATSIESDNPSYDSMSLDEIKNTLSIKYDQLNEAIARETSLFENQYEFHLALNVTKSFIDELEELLNFISTSNVTEEGFGILKITHGPYCNGLMKSDTILEIFQDLLRDVVDLVMSLNTSNAVDLKNATNSIPCRMDALSAVVRILPGIFSASEKNSIITSFNSSSTDAHEIYSTVQINLQQIEDELESVLEIKNQISSQINLLTEAYDQLLESSSTDAAVQRNVDDVPQSIVIEVIQIVDKSHQSVP